MHKLILATAILLALAGSAAAQDRGRHLGERFVVPHTPGHERHVVPPRPAPRVYVEPRRREYYEEYRPRHRGPRFEIDID
jgi:hypothetical protein